MDESLFPSEEVVPREFMNKSDTIVPLEENGNDFRLDSNITPRNVNCVCEDVCECSKEPLREFSPINQTTRNGYGSTTPSPSPSPEPVDQLSASIRCGCHDHVAEKTSRKARIKLVVACIIALIFVVGEVIGGYFSSSLAILTDAAHMLSDFASFLISLFSIWMASRPPSKRMSFGWHRAEVIGAIVSVLIIWLVTGVLCYEAVMRIIRNDIEIDADIMLITACVGVFVNVFMCMVLHQHDHGHDHGHGHGHGHSHAHGHSHSHGNDNNINDDDEMVENHSVKRRRWWQKKSSDVENGGSRRQKKDDRNINVRAAFIHVIGDLIQSIGVLIAGYIIKFWPHLSIVDPVCTFLFSILVIFTTLTVLRDAILVIMEGVPRHINVEQVKFDLQNIHNVKQAHNIHVWSLTTSKVALAAHLAVDSQTHSQDVLTAAGKMLKRKYGFAHTTLQVEKYQEEMSACGPCQGRTINKDERQQRSPS